MQENSAFAKICCPWLSENFRDLVIILSKKSGTCIRVFHLLLNISILIY